jgi:hypothetical protein
MVVLRFLCSPAIINIWNGQASLPVCGVKQGPFATMWQKSDLTSVNTRQAKVAYQQVI